MPFCALTTVVSGPIKGARRGAIAVRLCALSVSSKTSTGPTVAGSSVALGCAAKSPISPRTLTPCSCIARRCGPRAIRVTSSPALVNMAPANAPMAPAPTMANFMDLYSIYGDAVIELQVGTGSDSLNDGQWLVAEYSVQKKV